VIVERLRTLRDQIANEGNNDEQTATN
jgi:hypothetical protein